MRYETGEGVVPDFKNDIKVQYLYNISGKGAELWIQKTQTPTTNHHYRLFLERQSH